MTATRTARPAISREHRQRLQEILDQGDLAWFARNPTATSRRRFYFSGERIEDDTAATRYVVVTIERDRLVRRFCADEGRVA